MRDGHIGSDHETLDDILGRIVPSNDEILDHIILHRRRRFDGAERECAMLLANPAELFGRFELQSELGFHSRNAGNGFRHGAVSFQPGAHRRISQFRSIMNQSPINFVVIHFTGIEHTQLDHERSAVLGPDQGSQVGR